MKKVIKSHKLIAFLLLILFFIGNSSNLYAQEEFNSRANNKNLVADPVNAGKIEDAFLKLYEALLDGNSISSSVHYKELVSLGEDLGFEQFPQFSIKIILSAVSELKNLSSRDVSFRLNIAKRLSPQDGRVYALSSSLFKKIGYFDATKDAFWALILGFNQPSFIIQIMPYFVVAFLCSCLAITFLCLFVFCVLNFTKIYKKISSILPDKLVTFLSPLVVFSVLILPLYAGGPLVCILVWSLIVSLLSEKMRLAFSYCSFLLLIWVISLPAMAHLIKDRDVALSGAMERINTGSFSQIDANFIVENSLRDPMNTPLLFTRALVHQSRGEYSEAIRIYNSLIKRRDVTNSIVVASKNNIATIYFINEDFEKAKLELQALYDTGNANVQIIFNLAQSYLALLDMRNYETYYSKIKEKFDEKFFGRGYLSSERMRVIHMYLTPQIQLKEAVTNIKFDLSSYLFKGTFLFTTFFSDIPYLSEGFLFLCVFSGFLLSVLKKDNNNKNYYIASNNVKIYHFLLPGLSSLQNGSYVFGVIILSYLSSVLMMAFGLPVSIWLDGIGRINFALVFFILCAFSIIILAFFSFVSVFREGDPI